MTSRGVYRKSSWAGSGWDRFVRWTALLAVVGATCAFAWIAHEVRDGDHLAVENAIMRSLRRDGAPLGPPGTEGVVRDFTALGSAAVLATLTLLILGFLLLSGRRRFALVIVIATAGGQVLNGGLKNAFHRARPTPELRLVEVSSSSFPSGHAMAASIFYLTMGALLAAASPRRREKIYLTAAALLLCALIGFSRVYLGVHFPSDVAAGWAAGLAWAALCWLVTDWLGRRGAVRTGLGEAPAA